MPLVYSFVARDVAILAEYTPYQGNFNTIAVECLQKMNQAENKFTIAVDRHTFNFLRHNGFTYLVVADEAYGRQIPFAFLEKIRDEFEEKFADKGRLSPAFSLNNAFGPRLKAQMEYCMAHPEDISKVAALQKQVQEVHQIALHNVEKLMANQEKLEVVANKADDLVTNANAFARKGRGLRRHMWWQNCKMKLCLLFVVIILAIVIFCLACFTNGRNCTKRSDGSGGVPNPIEEAQNRFSNPDPSPAPTPATVPTGQRRLFMFL